MSPTTNPPPPRRGLGGTPTQIGRGKWLFFIILLLFAATFTLWVYLHVTESQAVEAAAADAAKRAEAAVEADAGVASDRSDTGVDEPADQSVDDAAQDTVEEAPAREPEVAAEVAEEAVDESVAWLGKYNAPPWQWIDWLMVSLMGVLLYLLTNVAYWYQKSYRAVAADPPATAEITPEDEAAKERRSGNARFLEFTLWYISTAVKGPLFALAILVFITNVSVDISGLQVDFRELGADVLLVVAFILGFFSRVAREQMNLIVKALFRSAYGRAEESFTILPYKAEVELGGSIVFKLSVPTDVTWHLDPDIGSIANGVYTAPVENDAATAGQEVQVQVTALPRDPNVPRSTATVTLKALGSAVSVAIVPDAVAVETGGQVAFKLEPADAAAVVDVTWAADKGTIDDAGLYTAPAASADDTAEVTATPKDGEPLKATVTIKATQPTSGGSP